MNTLQELSKRMKPLKCTLIAYTYLLLANYWHDVTYIYREAGELCLSIFIDSNHVENGEVCVYECLARLPFPTVVTNLFSINFVAE